MLTEEDIETLISRLKRAEELLKSLVANNKMSDNCQCGACEAKRVLNEIV